MAACELTITFDDATPRTGGQPITGTVTVTPTKAVTCKGLTISTLWSTSGRGNTDMGVVEEQKVFSGAWQPGQSYSYPFKLSTATWPPTYYGDYLSVSHYVKAHASLSWATDPKTQKEFVVVATDSPSDLKPTTGKTKNMGIIASVLLGLVGLVFGFLFIWLFVVLVVVIGPIAGLVWLFKVVLPRRITGPVEFKLKTPKVAPGGTAEAQLSFTPKTNSQINGIEWTINCIEECSSGSGSSRQTHRNQMLKEVRRISDAMQLKAGQKQSFDLSFQLPSTAAPSLKFTDNHVKWTLVGRIDIPRWPDWSSSLDLIVTPTASITSVDQRYALDDDEDFDEDEEDFEDEEEYQGNQAGSGAATAAAAAPVAGAVPADEAWFKQVIGQIRNSAHDDQQLAVVLEAVSEFEFPITISIEDQIDTPEFSDSDMFDRWDEADWWSAYCPAQNMDMAIAWELATPKNVTKGGSWSGSASIVGYEVDGQRLLMKAL